MSGTPISSVGPAIPLNAFVSQVSVLSVRGSYTASFIGPRMDTMHQPYYMRRAEEERPARDIWHTTGYGEFPSRPGISSGSTWKIPSGTPVSSISPPVPLHVWEPRVKTEDLNIIKYPSISERIDPILYGREHERTPYRYEPPKTLDVSELLSKPKKRRLLDDLEPKPYDPLVKHPCRYPQNPGRD